LTTGSFKRTDRVGKQVARMLSEILLTRTEDSRLKQVNITQVKVSADLRSAKVFYTLITPVPEIEKILSSAKHFLRSELARRLDMRMTPDLNFHYDDTVDQMRMIDALMKSQDRSKE
jgi:ribosome-binding factor A